MNSNCGTDDTKAPEVNNSESYGLECDMYSLGSVFVKLLTGEYPKHNRNYQIT
jgi:serine/threonine protein kinase